MIYELDREMFYVIEKLLDVDKCNIEPKSVMEKNNPGWIFVDNPENPKSALIWSKGIEGFYVAGDEKNPAFNEHFNEFIDTDIVPRAEKLDLGWFEINGVNPKWNDVLKEVLKERNLSTWNQYVYKYKKQQITAENAPANGNFKIQRIDEDFFESLHVDNMSFVFDILNLFWDSAENFLGKGIGYCAVCGDFIASVCYSSFISKNTHAIGIETEEEFRRKGFGQAAAAEVLKECLNKGFSAYWDCETTNVASYKLAEKIGFERDIEYTCFGFPFNG